jgi:hypothetical protein
MAIQPQEVGTTIYPIRNSNGHDYVIGKPYVVIFVDTDGTCKAKDILTSKEGNWLKWEDLTLTAPLGWIWLKKQLPQKIISILTLFDGVDQLILNEEYKDLILQELPDLMNRLETVGSTVIKNNETLIKTKASINPTANILSFPGGNGTPPSDQLTLEGYTESDDDYSIDDGDIDLSEDVPFEDMLDILGEPNELSKNTMENTSIHDGKDSKGNNIPDDI